VTFIAFRLAYRFLTGFDVYRSPELLLHHHPAKPGTADAAPLAKVMEQLGDLGIAFLDLLLINSE
jgi:hypothetical protein